LKSVFIIAIVAVAMIGVMVPSVFAESEFTGKAYDLCIGLVDDKTIPLKQLDECVDHWATEYELSDLKNKLAANAVDERMERIEQRHAETYNMQFLALGGTIAACAIIGIVVLKFVILKK